MRFLFLVFIIIPIIEIVILINVGEIIGAWYTVGLVVLSAFIGVNMLRYQGLSTLMRAQSKMNAGEIPANEMVEGIILAVGGALLVTPGFVTDFFGFCCLIPFTRQLFVDSVKKHFTVVSNGRQQAFYSSNMHQSGPVNEGLDENAKNQGNTYDGEYRRDE